MAVPKKRKSHSRARTQRAHQALQAGAWISCPQCKEPATLHHVCASCGFYRGRRVLSEKEVA